MVSWRSLVRLSAPDLARLDIAVMNLACFEGLPGADQVDWERCLRTLDEWAVKCRRFTDGVMPYFRAGQCDYPESEPRFRIQALISHLQRDLGVRYHPDRRADDAPFHPEDSFIAEVIVGEGGTCASLPVVYTAVARRLGYPLMLATTKSHLFCRWDALLGGDCFNIEASGEGLTFYPDEHYHTGRFEMPPEAVKACGYIESLSPREELASFLGQRAECWVAEKNFNEATTAFAWANELDPRRGQYALLTDQTIRRWKSAIQERLPSRLFPKLDLGLPAPHFRQMPREVERELIGLRVTEGLLNDPDLNRRWWEPLRRNPAVRPTEIPETLRIDYRWT